MQAFYWTCFSSQVMCWFLTKVEPCGDFTFSSQHWDMVCVVWLWHLALNLPLNPGAGLCNIILQSSHPYLPPPPKTKCVLKKECLILVDCSPFSNVQGSFLIHSIKNQICKCEGFFILDFSHFFLRFFSTSFEIEKNLKHRINHQSRKMSGSPVVAKYDATPPHFLAGCSMATNCVLFFLIKICT